MRWVLSLTRRRPSRVLGAAVGVALAVALLGTLGSFISSVKALMTTRAISQVAVDWQVEVQPGADQVTVVDALQKRADVKRATVVLLGQSSGFESTVGGTTQSTGPGEVLGLGDGYRASFPEEIRTLVGADDGVLIAQQTAANLRAAPGDTITIGRAGLPAASVRIDGVVELPAADSLFQKVGAPPGAQPSAPPDNVLLLPEAEWHRLFDPLVSSRPDLARTQVHVGLDHHLPADPAAAYTQASGAGRRFESDLAGGALVGNNLAATLDAARKDAAYAQVLFILLGIPGVVLAVLLARSMVAAGRDRRRRELALLRLRGASVVQLDRLAIAEAVAVALVGSAAGLVAASIIGRVAFGAAPSLAWSLVSTLVGTIVAITAVAVPARRDAVTVTVVAARQAVGRPGLPLVLRWGVDIAMLLASAAIFWATSRGHYQLLLWVGSGMFAWRLAELFLGRGGSVARSLLRPIARGLASPVSSTLRRQRRSLAASVALLALTCMFAISTAVFNATYRQQVNVDAVLTNGAPVTVTVPPGVNAPADLPTRLASVSGAGHVEAMQHRFVYVGADLQDLYGVDPATIGDAGKLQDAYFGGGTSKEMLDRLRAQPDGALVSDETARDFQLHLGDLIRVRVRDARSGQLTPVELHFAGIVKEFPTAPTDSFVVANASYVAKQTGDPSTGTYLIDTSGVSPRDLASRVRAIVGTAGVVTDIDTSRRVVGSSLTAVDLRGLTRIELGYALLLAMGATGLVLGLGLAQRRRAFAVTTAIGGRRSQLGAFIRSEAIVLGVLGGGLGAVGGWALAHMLVKVLTGVFDPPPAALSVPWGYLVLFAATAAASLATASELALRSTRRPLAEELRDL
jgi:putative ABC transport system permease protein